MDHQTREAIAVHFSGASWAIEAVKQEALIVVGEHMRPSVLYRPSLTADGTAWCALYGENLQEGVAGFGDTPDAAMRDFDKAWLWERTPAANRAALEPKP